MLVGKTVILRPVRESDLDQLYDLVADVRDMGPYWMPGLVSELQWKKELRETGWWEEHQGGLLITDRAGNIVGNIAFFKTAAYQNAYEIGYRIHQPENWGRGYATEALSLLVAYLFEVRPINRIQATVLPGHAASERVLEKCGFQFEGLMRQAIFHQGQHQDLRLYAILRDESGPLTDKLG
jgi:RimJ/RimL family protein N-acetyltransferase